jgi:mono/diheme cytochrome c family protein
MSSRSRAEEPLMKRTWTTLVALALAAGAVTFHPLRADAQTTPAPTSQGDVTRGKAAFLGSGCYECHGTAGQGNFLTAPRLAPHPLPFASLLAYIRKPAGSMPSYSMAILSDKDAADIYAYLSSIGPGKTPDHIPLLSGTTLTPK